MATTRFAAATMEAARKQLAALLRMEEKLAAMQARIKVLEKRLTKRSRVST